MEGVSATVLGILVLPALLLAVARPRLLLYAIFALVPTQFLFVPVATFFLSPADVLVFAAVATFAVRLLEGRPHARHGLYQHRWIVAVIAAYAIGLVVLDQSSRTLVRLALAVVPSILASELLRTRRDLGLAAAAIVAAGLVDAAYGAFYYARGEWLHPTRFSGMSGVNLSAMVIVTSAAVALTRAARARQCLRLLGPSLLMLAGAATLSRGGALAALTAWGTVLRRVVSRRNKVLLTAATVVVAVLSVGVITERLRPPATPFPDGVARSSGDVRLLIMSEAWRAFLEQPVVGVGFGRFQAYSTTNPAISASTAGLGYGTHNTFLEILVEGGLLAFVPFLLHFMTQWPRLVAAWRAVVRDRDLQIGATLVGLPVVMVSAAFANVALHYSFWAVCGLAMAGANVVHAERRHYIQAGVSRPETGTGWQPSA